MTKRDVWSISIDFNHGYRFRPDAQNLEVTPVRILVSITRVEKIERDAEGNSVHYLKDHYYGYMRDGITLASYNRLHRYFDKRK